MTMGTMKEYFHGRLETAAYLGILILGFVSAAFHFYMRKIHKQPVVGNNPIFVKFRQQYFLAYFLAILGDWLQTPYLYKLYSSYGFGPEQIAVLYVCGFASSVILGMWTPMAADRFGRKKLCVVFTVTYTVSCILQLCVNYGLLMLARILGGVATSVLFNAFEAWYIHEHIDNHDFPKEWIPLTFSKATLANALLAVSAGVVSNIFAEWFNIGPVAPFVLAIPCLLGSGFFVMRNWTENYGAQKTQFSKSCQKGLHEVTTDRKLLFLGVIQSCYESVMYIFVFIWTPVLLFSEPPLGIIFACFMLCVMIGNLCQSYLSIRKVPMMFILTISCAITLIANAMCIVSSSPGNRNFVAAFVAFLIIQLSTGLYFPTMGKIRNFLVPNEHRKSIANIFRVPLNLIACLALLMFHDHSSGMGNRPLFVLCTALLAVAVGCCVLLNGLVKSENISLEAETEATDEL